MSLENYEFTDNEWQLESKDSDIVTLQSEPKDHRYQVITDKFGYQIYSSIDLTKEDVTALAIHFKLIS